jgi:hypothetical protein
MTSLLPGVCSTSYPTAAVRQRGGASAQGRTAVRVHAADAFCKDKVNTVKRVNVEGTATVTFLGAGGQSVAVECPKVRWGLVLLWPPGSPLARLMCGGARTPARKSIQHARHRTHTYWTPGWRRAWSCRTPAGAASAGARHRSTPCLQSALPGALACTVSVGCCRTAPDHAFA